jgi:hypothetical protein
MAFLSLRSLIDGKHTFFSISSPTFRAAWVSSALFGSQFVELPNAPAIIRFAAAVVFTGHF